VSHAERQHILMVPKRGQFDLGRTSAVGDELDLRRLPNDSPLVFAVHYDSDLI
jgi:hypothetical protein